MSKELKEKDFEIFDLIEKEKNRQKEGIELIASENFVSKSVREATGSILTNKYAEGYPSKRYYGGCEFVDHIENLAIERVKKLFNAKFANVQPHSGSQANMAALFSLLNIGDKILSMNLSHGGHLTHGHKMSFSGKLYECYFYGVDKETETINYEEVLKIAREIKPKLIIAGASAYSREIDFKRFKEIAKEIGAYLMVDMAHIAGLVAAGLHPNPIEYADIVTSTTHKTLRGPRGGLILTNSEEISEKINKNLFPGIQGGPLMHIIAAKAVCFGEALQENFKLYQRQIIENAQILSQSLKNKGFKIVSNGTDNHLFMINLTNKKITGKGAEDSLYQAHITVNKNAIPFDMETPFVTSGIRLGTAAVTTRGMKASEMIQIAEFIDESLNNIQNKEHLLRIKKKVKDFTKDFPLFSGE